MRKLLSANFSRLWKDKIFWLGILFMFGFGIFGAYTKYSNIVRYNSQELLDDILFAYVILVGCCLAVFCSMFLGTEYSDGTIRNKLIVGHLRSSIYLSNWLTNIVAAIMMAIAFLLSYSTLGSLLLEPPKASVGQILFYMLISIFTLIAYASIFSTISMLITKKSNAAVICLLIFFGLLILAMVVKAKLDAPEFISEYSMTMNGVEQTDPKPNPKYLQPAARKVYQFFLDILPTGQSIQLSAFQVVHPLLSIVYSTVISILSTVSGIFAFQKKNLK